MRRVTIHILNIVVCIFVTLAVCRSAASAYVSKNGYLVQPPAEWMPNTTGLMGTDVFFYLPPVDGFAPNINVVVVPAKPGENLAASEVELTRTFKAMFAHYHQVSQRIAHLDGLPAIETAATYERGERIKMWIHQVVAVGHTSDFVFTLTGDAIHKAKYEVGFTVALKSVRIINR